MCGLRQVVELLSISFLGCKTGLKKNIYSPPKAGSRFYGVTEVSTICNPPAPCTYRAAANGMFAESPNWRMTGAAFGGLGSESGLELISKLEEMLFFNLRVGLMGLTMVPHVTVLGTNSCSDVNSSVLRKAVSDQC